MKKQIQVLVTLLVGVAAMLGLVVASASAASAATIGPQSFTGLSISPTSGTNPVAANGVIHAGGTDRVINTTTDVFTFPRGALLVRHHPATTRQTLDPVTCFGQFTERGIWNVPAGTRAYLGARGRGSYVARGVFVTARSPLGRCLPNVPPVLYQLSIQATGALRLP